MNFPLNRSGEHEINKTALTAPSLFSAQRAKRRTAELAKTLSGEVATFQTDRCGFITSWPYSAELIFGFELGEILGKHVAIIYCDADLKYGRAAYELMAADTSGSYAADGWQRRKNGQQFWAHTEHRKTESGFQIFVLELPAWSKKA